MAIIIRNADGSTSELGLSGAALGIGTTQVARQLEVVEVILTRLVPDGPGPAAAFSAHEGGLASLWTNPSYTTEAPTSGFVRTINMKNGNVGIGSSKDAKALDPEEKLVVVGNILATGDVKLEGSDCAEDFDVHDLATLEPGMVVVIGDEERLKRCCHAYDRRVAGVLSGAGDCRPGIVLGKQPSGRDRLPLALTGKVFCHADASYSPIGLGDLLTTSPTPGHAMKAADASQAFGAVLGKAMRALSTGRGLIPILVALQ